MSFFLRKRTHTDGLGTDVPIPLHSVFGAYIHRERTALGLHRSSKMFCLVAYMHRDYTDAPSQIKEHLFFFCAVHKCAKQEKNRCSLIYEGASVQSQCMHAPRQNISGLLYKPQAALSQCIHAPKMLCKIRQSWNVCSKTVCMNSLPQEENSYIRSWSRQSKAVCISLFCIRKRASLHRHRMYLP